MPHVTREQLIDLLPPGNMVHTFLDSSGMLIGADWSREKIVNAIERAAYFGLTGDRARAMEHGIYCEHPDKEGLTVFVATRGKLHGGEEPNWKAYSYEGRH